MELSGSSSSWLWLSSDVQTSSAAWCFLRPGPCQGHWLQSHRKVFFPLSWDPQLFTAGSNGDEGNVNSGEEAGLWQEEHSPGQLLLTKSSSQWECSSCWHPTCYPLCLPPVGKSGKDLLSSPPPQCWVSSWRTGKLKHRMHVACWCLECQGNSHWLCEQWKWKRKKKTLQVLGHFGELGGIGASGLKQDCFATLPFFLTRVSKMVNIKIFEYLKHLKLWNYLIIYINNTRTREGGQ